MIKWKPVIGYEDYYEISNDGQVKSLLNNIILKGSKSRYHRVQLCKDGVRKAFNTHRLVAIHFIDNPENKPHVNHKNGDKLDNRVDNIEWCTQAENIKHAFDTGLRGPTFPKGTIPPQFKGDKYYFKNGNIPWNKGKRQKPPTHGTLYEYNKGCRCDECKKANTDYCRNKRHEWIRAY
jgi:hypothetical protein